MYCESTLGGKIVAVLFLGMFTDLQKATVSFVICVCLSVSQCAWNNLAPTGQIFVEFPI